MFLGRINEQLVKSVFPLYYVAALGILYFGIRRFSSRTYALVFTFILASISQFNNFATNGYMDLPLAYYYLAGTLFLFYWFRETDKTGFLYISAIMTALARGVWCQPQRERERAERIAAWAGPTKP